MPRAVALAVAAGVLVAVLLATLLPSATEPHAPSACLVCGPRGVADAIVNVALFVPVGLALALLLGPGRAVLGGFLLSLLIEAAQLWVPGRHTALADLLYNSAGALGGVLLLLAAPKLLRPARRAALLLAAVWSMAALALLATGVRVLEPIQPDANYYGQWTPDLSSWAHYDGRVLAARLGDVALPSWRLSNTSEVRTLLARGATLHVEAIAGTPPEQPAPLFAIAVQDEHVLTLAIDGDDVIYRYYARATAHELDMPDLRVRDALRGVAPGERIVVDATPAAGGRRVSLTVNGVAAEASLGVGDTWGLLYWSSWISRHALLRALLRVVWLAALAGPAVYWLLCARRGRASTSAPREPVAH